MCRTASKAIQKLRKNGVQPHKRNEKQQLEQCPAPFDDMYEGESPSDSCLKPSHQDLVPGGSMCKGQGFFDSPAANGSKTDGNADAHSRDDGGLFSSSFSLLNYPAEESTGSGYRLALVREEPNKELRTSNDVVGGENRSQKASTNRPCLQSAPQVQLLPQMIRGTSDTTSQHPPSKPRRASTGQLSFCSSFGRNKEGSLHPFGQQPVGLRHDFIKKGWRGDGKGNIQVEDKTPFRAHSSSGQLEQYSDSRDKLERWVSKFVLHALGRFALELLHIIFYCRILHHNICLYNVGIFFILSYRT